MSLKLGEFCDGGNGDDLDDNPILLRLGVERPLPELLLKSLHCDFALELCYRKAEHFPPRFFYFVTLKMKYQLSHETCRN